VTVIFGILLALGVVLGAIAGLLIWRARSAPQPPAAASVDAQDASDAPATGWLATVLAAIDYAHTRRAWRYGLPWILLLGERGAGKTSFALSAGALVQSHPDRRYASLKVPGSVCAVMNRGVMIDIDGAMSSTSAIATVTAAATAGTSVAAIVTVAPGPAAAPSSAAKKAQSRWQNVLSSLVDLRPERPADGIVLTVSARTLLNADSDGLGRCAADVYRQLCDVQDTFRFVLPVSVVVTQCDRIDGFAAFWRAQPAELRKQMFGWSAPALAPNDTPREWSDAAFDTVIEQLRSLQLDSAARAQANLSVADHDGMLMFPARLDALRAPLAQWLSTAFRATVDRPGHLCRGIYFTGDAQGAGLAARNDVAFVEGLLDNKVFAEQGAARVIRASAWSRNRYLRAFQVGAVSVAAALAIGLGIAGIRLYSTVNQLDKALVQLQTVPAYSGGVCPSASEISSLLMSVRDLNTRSFDLANPWSWPWFWNPLRSGAAQVVATHVFARVILPGLGCQLTVRAQDLLALGQRSTAQPADSSERVRLAREALNAQLRAVTDLEASLGTFEKVARPLSGAATEVDLNHFAQLINFAYGLPVSLVLQQSHGNGLTDGNSSLLAAALSSASTGYQPNLPANLADIYASQLARMERELRDALVAEASAGQTLLTNLSAGTGDPAAQTRQLVWWLDWTRDQWLGSTAQQAQRNLCGQIRIDLRQQVGQLVLTDSSSARQAPGAGDAPATSGSAGGTGGAYASPYRTLLGDTDTTFSATGCDAPVYAVLDALSVPPYDPLIVRARGERIFNPAFANEFTGLTALSQLHFMQATQTRGAFACSADGGSSRGWNADALGDATAYVDEYRRFAQRLGLKPSNAPGARPLYGQIAARQLENALNHALNDAQRAPPPSAGVWPAGTASTALSPVPFDEQALAQASRELALSLAPLVSIERSYNEFGFSGSYAALSGCLQQFSANRLSTVSSLAVQSQLYRPQTGTTGPEFFDLGTVAVTRDYLARQVARAQVLAAYAAPFATLSQNSGNAANAGPNVQTAGYWSNSIAEVNRYVPSGDPASQMGQLASLFVDRLNGMTADNCGARLQNQPGTPGDGANDLFATLRRSLVTYTTMRCQGSDTDAFDKLFALFDATLAGRYPFALAGAPDASPLAVRDFFAAYAQQSALLRAQLSLLPKSQQAPVREFLNRLDDSQKFFSASLRADGSLAVHLNASFNVRQSAERGADQVVGWTLGSASQLSSYPNGPAGIDWIAGQPLVLDLTWADLSRWAPYADADLPGAPDVDGRTATFTAGGTWALMRFVQQHGAERGASPAQGVTLRFSVPVATTASPASSRPPASTAAPLAATSIAQLMVNLQLQGVDTTSHTVTPLTLPNFPSNAPVLHPSQASARGFAYNAQIPSIPSLPPLPPGLDAEPATSAAAN
jgi:type VI secretion system protein ImpL